MEVYDKVSQLQVGRIHPAAIVIDSSGGRLLCCSLQMIILSSDPIGHEKKMAVDGTSRDMNGDVQRGAAAVL